MSGLAPRIRKRIATFTFQALASRTGETKSDHRFTELVDNVMEQIFTADLKTADLYLSMFMSPFPSAESVRVDLGKARIVLRGAERLHGNRLHGISSLSQENLDAFVRQCLAHPNVQVKEIGKELANFIEGDQSQ